MTLSLEQHCPLLPLPSRLSGRQTLFARSPAGQWQWGLWKCVGNIWQVEKIFIFMGKEQGKIQRRSLHRDFKQETHRLDILSLAGHNRELKERVLLLSLPPLLLSTICIVGNLKKGISLAREAPRKYHTGPSQGPGPAPPPPPPPLPLPLTPRPEFKANFLWSYASGLSEFLASF